MHRSTPRTGLTEVAALLVALSFAFGWAESGPVLAHATVEGGGRPANESVLADPRMAASAFGWLFDLPEPRAEIPAGPVVEAKQSKPAKATATVATNPTYSGRNRFWIPSLDMNYKVHLFECTRNRPPDNYMYRWGCAGENNVYILGHAYSVMKPLHDLYVRGKLKKGMVAIYADAQGHVHRYKVTEWRVVDPVDSEWAIASQPVPSMTLQTCVGKDGRYRLNVRLVQFR